MKIIDELTCERQRRMQVSEQEQTSVRERGKVISA